MSAPSVTAVKRIVGRGRDGYGHRPVNAWGDGDLPCPYAVGDVVDVPAGSAPVAGADERDGRLYGDPGVYVVSSCFSIDEGDAWYVRLTHPDGWEAGRSDRLHVAWAERSTWDRDVDWMWGTRLLRTADPEGLEMRNRMLERGWTCPEVE